MNLLITYDISDDKKRRKVEKLLSSYGYRANYSVFEIEIKANQLKKLEENLKNLAKDGDSIRIYYFTKDTIAKSRELNNKLSNPFESENGYVF